VNENSSDSGQVPAEDPKQTLLAHPILDFSDADLAAMLKRVVRLTAVLGVLISLILWPVMGWQTGALFAVGAAISVGSVYEWARLIRTITERMDGRPGTGSGLGAGLVVFLFLVRLSLFAVAIYVSLKCFHGSPIALLCGLGLALAGLVWEAMRVLRG
jgi:hypothetical protein